MITKRKFVKALRCGGWSEKEIGIFVNAVARRKGRLSYLGMTGLIFIAKRFGRQDVFDIVGYVDAVMELV